MMSQLLLILLMVFSVQGILAPAGSVSGAVPGEDAALEQWAEQLEPICEFEVTEEYPGVILELFDPLIGWENGQTPDQSIVDTSLQSVVVYGTQEEFCAVYTYGGELEYAEGTGSEPFGEMTLQVRMRRKDAATYELVALGGGPIAYGLELTDWALENIG